VGTRLKTFEAARSNPAGLSFSDLQRLLSVAGFALVCTSGSHRVYTRAGVEEIVNIQPKGRGAKPYQVRQVVDLIEKYGIEIE
jgi:hypothetical protein